MLHGLGGSIGDWTFMIPFLSKKYQLILLDLKGFGKSKSLRNSKEYTIQRLAQEVETLLSHIGISRFGLVGFSFGGAVAFQMASKKTTPLSITSLVIICSQPSYRLTNRKMKVEYYFRYLLLKTFGIKVMASVISKRLFPGDNQDELKLFVKNGLRSNNTQTYLDAMKALVSWSVEDKLADINIPVLVIGADRDYSSLDCTGYANKLPNATVTIVEDCGHASLIEKPVELSSAIEDFVPANEY
ncbi:MAG: alpha/beta hydrolase [Methylococcaceae bacterium]